MAKPKEEMLSMVLTYACRKTPIQFKETIQRNHFNIFDLMQWFVLVEIIEQS